MSMQKIIPIPALNDNYIWLIMHPEKKVALIVDPGDAQPVLTTLKHYQLKLAGILVTHHHWDHTQGIPEILQHYPAPVYGPANDGMQTLDHRLKEGDSIKFESIATNFKILDIPGHTRGHIAFIGLGGVFCGDTLFTAGCGRLFEGTPEQMLHSLEKLSQLPPDTQVYCGHEYTATNLKFAQTVEPNNKAIADRIKTTQHARQQQQPTVPASLSIEFKTNPFLRVNQQSVQTAIKAHYQQTFTTPTTYFAALRHWKDQFN